MPALRNTRRWICALALCLMGPCAWVAGDAAPSGDEPGYYPTANSAYKKTGSARFNFWFDLPLAWRAFDRSANGDGYFLEVGSPDVDARVYGYYDMDETRKRRGKARFRFADGKKGWREAKPGSVSYTRREGSRFQVFYVKAPEAWMKANAVAVTHVAKSLRPGSTRK